MVGYYNVVALCGSPRFKKEFQEIQEKLTLDGCIVITVGVLGYTDIKPLVDGTVDMLTNMQKKKIDMADEVYIVDIDYYIEDSVKAGIEYAKGRNKIITFHSNKIYEKKNVNFDVITTEFLLSSFRPFNPNLHKIQHDVNKLAEEKCKAFINHVSYDVIKDVFMYDIVSRLNGFAYRPMDLYKYICDEYNMSENVAQPMINRVLLKLTSINYISTVSKIGALTNDIYNKYANQQADEK